MACSSLTKVVSLLFFFISVISLTLTSKFQEYNLKLGESYNISYNSRSLTINNENILLTSGGFHYGRGLPNAWDHVMKLFKQMNLNTLQTYKRKSIKY